MRPVLVGGCPRSGTTLLGAMLGAHPDCLCVPEMPFKYDILRAAGWDRRAVPNDKEVERVAALSRFRIWGLKLDLVRLRQERLSSAPLIERIVQAYGENLGKRAARVWIDHTPSNTQYAWKFLQMFPEAKFVHIVRDGRAVAASLMPLDWGPNHIDRAARYWIARVVPGLAAESMWGRTNVLRVRYEDLVNDPDRTLKDLCRELGLTYEPAMAEATGFTPPTYTRQQHTLIGHRPDPIRVNAWERQLTSRQIEIFESIAADLLAGLGYDLKFGIRARPMSRKERLASKFREAYRASVNRVRLRSRRIQAEVQASGDTRSSGPPAHGRR